MCNISNPSRPDTFEAVADNLTGIYLINVSRDILSEEDESSRVLNLEPAVW